MELDELDNELNHIVRVTPLGLSDVSAMTAFNQRVLDMMTNKVVSQSTEVETWKVAYTTLFKVNEQHIEKIEWLQSALQTILDQDCGKYLDLYNRIRAIARAALEME